MISDYALILIVSGLELPYPKTVAEMEDELHVEHGSGMDPKHLAREVQKLRKIEPRGFRDGIELEQLGPVDRWHKRS